ncbi:MAG: penicillin-binding protein 2 [Proteobacteria bacterium]|nr:penicillin-binding protein 2 [Pseudomonadota bacterium]
MSVGARSAGAARAAGARSVNYATSPLLASRTPPWRSRFVVLLVGAAFALLLGRAVYVQIAAAGFYQAQGAKRFVHRERVPASRGRILDRNGLVLATSVAMPTVQVDLKAFAADTADRKARIAALARALDVPKKDVAERLEGASGTVTLRRHIEEPVWLAVKALGLEGVSETREYRRRYPEGEAAAHVVGFTDVDDKGQEGIELGFESQLEGRAGQRTVVRDRLGRVVEDVGEPLDPLNGDDVTLAIDSKVQFFAWQCVRDAVRAHQARGGSVVVLDAKTGELLALANYPSFDPGQRRRVGGEQLRNRALTDTFEPGSTMKPFTIALALETGRVKPTTPIQTAPGSITVTGSTIRDSHPHGVLTVAEVIQKSSNVGTTKIALQMDRREMWEMFTSVGLGQKPRIDFPGAVTGRLRPWKSWRPIEQATMSYGYGLSVSLMQLARAYTAFARDGEVVPVTIVKRASEQPVAGQRVMSARTAREVRQMLQLAAGPGGTAPKAQTLGYSVGGKTGTARKQEGRGYGNKYRAWFVGLAPVSDPRIVVAVMVDEPGKGSYFGGEVAAPVFSQVVQQTLRMLGVPPDLEVRPQIVGKPVPAEIESF